MIVKTCTSLLEDYPLFRLIAADIFLLSLIIILPLLPLFLFPRSNSIDSCVE